MPDIGYASGTSHKEGIMTTDQGPFPAQYPVQFAVEYPDRPLNRLTSFFRIFVIIPIAIVLGTVSGATWQSAGSHSTMAYGAAGAPVAAAGQMAAGHPALHRAVLPGDRRVLRGDRDLVRDLVHRPLSACALAAGSANRAPIHAATSLTGPSWKRRRQTL